MAITILNNFYYNRYDAGLWNKTEDKQVFAKHLTETDEYNAVSYNEWNEKEIERDNKSELPKEIVEIIKAIKDGIERKDGEQFVMNLIELAEIISRLEGLQNIYREDLEAEIQELMETSDL